MLSGASFRNRFAPGRARALWQLHYQHAVRSSSGRDVPDLLRWLERPTFFSELRRPERAALRAALWPAASLPEEHDALIEAYREWWLRGQLLASAARLGHSLIDLYVLVPNRRVDARARSVAWASGGRGHVGGTSHAGA